MIYSKLQEPTFNNTMIAPQIFISRARSLSKNFEFHLNGFLTEFLPKVRLFVVPSLATLEKHGIESGA